MSLARSYLVGGPCKIFTGSATFWTPDTIRVQIVPTTNELRPSAFGRIGEAEHDRILNVSSFTPFGLWQFQTTLIPTFYTAPVAGARLYGDTDVPWKIWGINGDLITIKNGAVVKPPSFTLGANGPIYGPMSIAGLAANGADPNATNSYYQVQVGQADPGGAFATTSYKQQLYTFAWGAVSGFGTMDAEDKLTISIEPKLEPAKLQGWTRDMKLDGVPLVTATLIPVGPTMAQLYAAIEDMTAGGRLGEKAIGDLVATGVDGTTSVTAVNMAIKQRGFAFGAKELRLDALSFVNVAKFTAGALSPIVSWT